MSPRPPIPPTPPAKIVRALQAPREETDHRENPLLERYLRDLWRSGIVPLLGLHYVMTIVLGAIAWVSASGGPVPHPEMALKIIGGYCFLVATLAVPLVSPIFLPATAGETDPACDAVPMTPVTAFDARFIATVLVSGLAAFPLLPLFLLFDPIFGNNVDPYDLFPFIQATATGAWVYLIMEMASPRHDTSGRLGRRLAVIAAFVLLHVGLVGLLARVSWATIQHFPPLKLLIDINPFSQLFLMMEGPGQIRFLVNTYAPLQRRIDFRLYLLVVHILVLIPTWLVYRALLHKRSR